MNRKKNAGQRLKHFLDLFQIVICCWQTMVNLKTCEKNENFKKSEICSKMEAEQKKEDFTMNASECEVTKYKLSQIDKNEIFELTLNQVSVLRYT